MSIFQPTNNLNLLLRQYGTVTLNDNVPAPPSGRVNIMWETDTDGNLAASVPNTSSLNPRGAYSPSTTYSTGDVVSFNGSSYLSIVDNNINHEPDTSPSDWQLLAQGGGSVDSGSATQLAFYGSTGTTVSATNITTNSEKTSLTVPSVLSSFQDITSGLYAANLDPNQGAFPTLQQSSVNSTVFGGGWSLGNSGGWTVSKNENLTQNVAQRGIAQNRAGILNKHAVGDTAGIYSYVFADGGISAGSDEGVTAITAQAIENPGYFHGTVASTTGKGDQAPVLAFTSGNNWTTDGAFLLNISKGTLSGNLNGASSALSLTTGAGSQSTFLNSLPVTGVTLPRSTAIGIATAAIANPVVAANNPVSTTVTVTLCEINGTFPGFTAGQSVTVGGNFYPEQSIVNNVVDHGDGTQTLTLKLRNPNGQAIVFQGGVQGQYISFDANLALSGMRSSYYAYGSLTGSDLIYYVNVAGGISTTLPMIGSEAAQTSGANSGFHLYPGAEVVANTDFGFACTLEQNGVVWAHNDVVENPHYPVYGGSAALIVATQFTPSSPGFGGNGLYISMNGPGTAGGNNSGLRIDNLNNESIYQGDGGPLLAPVGIKLQGPFSHNIYMSQAPDSGVVLLVKNNNAASSDITQVIQLNWSAGGALNYISSADRWAVSGAFDAQNGFLSNHVPGVSASFTTGDGRTATFSGGILVGIS